MKVVSIELLWPYGPDSDRAVDQMDVVVELDDESRWMSSFYDTHRFNQGVKGFRGLGPDQRFRFQQRMIIVSAITEDVVRETVEALIDSGDFDEAFELVAAAPTDSGEAG